MCREGQPPTDRTMARLLLDAPALPQPAVARFLLEVAQQEGDWATLALSCARDLVMHRIPDRWSPDAVVLAQQDRQWATQCSAACHKPHCAVQAWQISMSCSLLDINLESLSPNAILSPEQDDNGTRKVILCP